MYYTPGILYPGASSLFWNILRIQGKKIQLLASYCSPGSSNFPIKQNKKQTNNQTHSAFLSASLLSCVLINAVPTGKSALHWAAAVNNVEATLLLLKNGANRDMQDNKVSAEPKDALSSVVLGGHLWRLFGVASSIDPEGEEGLIGQSL